MPPSSVYSTPSKRPQNKDVFRVYLDHGKLDVKPADEHVPIGFEKRDKIPRTPPNTDAEYNGTSDAESFKSIPLTCMNKGNVFNSNTKANSKSISITSHEDSHGWCWRNMCIIN